MTLTGLSQRSLTLPGMKQGSMIGVTQEFFLIFCGGIHAYVIFAMSPRIFDHLWSELRLCEGHMKDTTAVTHHQEQMVLNPNSQSHVSGDLSVVLQLPMESPDFYLTGDLIVLKESRP